MDAAENKRARNVSLPNLNLLGNSRLLFRVVICRSAMFSVPRFPNRSLCFGLERRNGRTLASDRGPYANRIPRTSNRSGCFDLKRRSNRTQASIRGSYGNRGCAAREICDDEEACEAHSDEASGGPISLTREKSGKERGGAPPLHPGAAGAEAKGALTRRRTSGCGTSACRL